MDIANDRCMPMPVVLSNGYWHELSPYSTQWCVPDWIVLVLCIGDEYRANSQGPADAAAAAVRQKQPVSEVAMDVQIQLQIQLGETDER